MDEHFYERIILIVLMVLGSLLTFQTVLLWSIALNSKDIKYILEKSSCPSTEKGSEYRKYPPTKNDYVGFSLNYYVESTTYQDMNQELFYVVLIISMAIMILVLIFVIYVLLKRFITFNSRSINSLSDDVIYLRNYIAFLEKENKILNQSLNLFKDRIFVSNKDSL